VSVPRVMLGLPSYNGEAFLREALESLLSQTEPRLRIIVVDDGSTDDTVRIAQAYARSDDRLRVHRNPDRLGMVANWRRAFSLAQDWIPDVPYFMWASDHDVWHPRFVARLADYLDAHPEAVAAYPLTCGISEEGVVIREPFRFDTEGISSRWERVVRTQFGMAAGFMVYGMFRAEALAACGVYRTTLVPDRLLLTELSLLGELQQVPEILWLRRFRTGEKPSLDRQRATFWPGRRPPWWSHLPWWASHPVALAYSQALRGEGRPMVSRGDGAQLAGAYLGLGLAYSGRRRARRVAARARRARKGIRREAGLVRRDLRGVGSKAVRRHPRVQVAVWATRGSWRLLRDRDRRSTLKGPSAKERDRAPRELGDAETVPAHAAR
jgi:hypothetical protein